MIARVLQEWIDQVRTTSHHRWMLVAGAVGAAVGAAFAAGLTQAGLIAVIVVIALAGVVQASTNWALILIGIVVVGWLNNIDDVMSPRSVAAAIFLLVFHVAVALVAVTPHSARIDRKVLRAWSVRTAVVAATAPAIWLLAVLFERRDASGSTLLSAAAVLAVAGGALVVRTRSLTSAPDPFDGAEQPL